MEYMEYMDYMELSVNPKQPLNDLNVVQQDYFVDLGMDDNYCPSFMVNNMVNNDNEEIMEDYV